MHISCFFSFHKMLAGLLLGMLITIVFSSGVWGTASAYAADGRAHFDISPTFFPQKEIAPRANFIYNSHPGALIHDSLHVTNDSKVRGTIILHTEDAGTSPESGETFAPTYGKQHDVGYWITLSKQQATLNPGQSLDIPFSVKIPTHVRPGQHAGGIVAEEPDQKQAAAQGSFQSLVQIHAREVIGVLINLPGTTIEQLKTTGISYDTTSKYQRVLVELSNTGTQFLHPSGSMQITNISGQQLQNISMTLHAILPQTAIDYPLYIPQTALQPGTYTAQLQLTYEGNHHLNYKASIVVPLPIGNTRVGGIISQFVAPDTNIFSSLTPAEYIIGGIIIFSIFSAVFFWGRQFYSSVGKLKKNRETDTQKKP